MLKRRYVIFKKMLRFKNQPIFVKIFLCFISVFVLIVILSYANFSFYEKDKESTALDIIRQTNLQAIDKIDNYLQDMCTTTKFPLLSEYNETKFMRLLNNFNATNKSDLSFQKSTDQIFNTIINFKSQIDSIFIFNLKGSNEYRMKNTALFKPYNPSSEKWFQDSIDAFGRPVIISTFKMSNVADIDNEEALIFSVARGILDVDTSRVIGVIMVNSKMSFLSDICQKMIIAPGQRIVIADSKDNIIYDTVSSNITKKLDSSLQNLLGEKINLNEKVYLNNTSIFINYAVSGFTNWKIINIIPVEKLNLNINRMKTVTTILTFTIIIIAFVLVLFISRQIAKPLKKLVLLLKLFEKGNFDVKIRPESRDEIGSLARAFNKMTIKVKRLIKEVYFDKLKQKELELQMLQNQINPHFLYNSLDSIHMMAEINEDYETSKMATALAKIFRYGISQTNVKVTVKEEIENLKEYIMLQQVRFEDIFSIQLDIDESLADHIIIKLILQPLLENAIYHGINSRGEKGFISISGYIENETLIFEVSDNGDGMDLEQLALLNGYINGLNHSFKSIGLKNVNKRIKLYYGDKYGIQIFSTVNAGTKVKVTIPC
jgi:Predicted signal transduction protein with a C-terminal ATPase domain